MAIIAVACLFYYRFDPSSFAWMPQCPVHLLTGWQCPSCGAQRAFHSLLHGDLAAAFRFNPFLTVSTPYLAAALWGCSSRLPRGLTLRRLTHSRGVVGSYITLYLIWWVVRNIFSL